MTTFFEGLYYATIIVMMLFLVTVFLKWMVECIFENEWYIKYFGSLFFLWLVGMTFYIAIYLLGGLE